jgi:O-antigen/teichoic acid export membrane protein
MGQVRVVTYFNLVAGIAMLILMLLLIPIYGLQGAAMARLIYGPITCLAYFHLYSVIYRAGHTRLSHSVQLCDTPTGTTD